MSLRPAYRVVLTDPNGTVWEIHDRLDASAAVRLNEETEADLLQFVYSDLDLRLMDDDGWASAMFRSARRGDVFEVVLERSRGDGGSDRLFAGVVDLPVKISKGERTVDVTVLSYAKLFELQSAESLQRSITGRTGSVSSGTAVVTLSSTAGLAPGDVIALSGSGSESHTILTVDSSTQVTTVDNWSATYSAAAMTLETPYHRGKTLAELATMLSSLAGFKDVQVDLAAELARIPFPTSLNSSGLPGVAPTTIVEKSSNLTVYSSGNKYSATSPSSGFTSGGAAAAQADWRPQLAVEPASLQPWYANRIYDYTDAAHPYYWYRTNVSGGNVQVILTKNGVDVAVVDTFPYGYVSDGALRNAYLEVSPWGEVWISYVADWSAPYYDPEADLTVARTRYKTITLRCSTAGAVLSSWLTYGSMRHCAKVDRMAFFPIAEAGKSEPTDPPVTALILLSTPLALYDHGTQAASLERADYLVMDTFRAFSTFFACVSSSGSRTAVVLWNQADGTLAATHTIVARSTATNIATTFRGALTADEYDGYAGGVWFSISTRVSGVIPYADFTGLSAAAAMKELAIAAGAHFWVDDYRVVYIVARGSATLTSREPADISDPLDCDERPVWEWLRRSVVVSAKTEDGRDIEAVAGDSGDSASRLSISPQLPMTEGLASALANAHVAFLSPERVQLDEKHDEPTGGFLRLLGAARRDGKTYQVLRVETNYTDEEQTVQLVEIEG